MSQTVGPRVVRVCFDVDDTLIDLRGRLRPHTLDVFEELAGRGFHLYVWSGAGIRWEVVNVHGLRPHVVDCFRKPTSLHHQRLADHGVPFVPDFVVDDDIEVVEAFGGYHMAPPPGDFSDDLQMLASRDAVLRRFMNGGAPR